MYHSSRRRKGKEPQISENRWGKCLPCFSASLYFPIPSEENEFAEFLSQVLKSLLKTSQSLFKFKINKRNHTKINKLNSIKINAFSMSKTPTQPKSKANNTLKKTFTTTGMAKFSSVQFNSTQTPAVDSCVTRIVGYGCSRALLRGQDTQTGRCPCGKSTSSSEKRGREGTFPSRASERPWTSNN